MHHFTLFFRTFAYVQSGMEILISYLLLRRRLYREVPWFTIYIVFQILSNIAVYRIYESGDALAYFYIGYAFEGISVTIAFMVILETFRISFPPAQAIRKFAVTILIVAVILSITIALVFLPYGAKASGPEARFVTLTERSLRMIQLSLLVTMFGLSSYLSLRWRHYVFGIALGYGLYAALNLACQTYVGYIGGHNVALKTSIIDSSGYCCALAIWLIYLLQPEATRPTLPPSAHHDLQKWSDALSVFKKSGRRDKQTVRRTVVSA
jgi:hypothetical protein